MAIELKPLSTYTTGIFDEGAAEIPAYDPLSKRLFVVNGATQVIDVLDLSDPTNPIKVGELDISAYGISANSVAVKNGIVAAAVEAEDGLTPGQAVFFDTDGNFLSAVPVGVLPDMLTFTPDGTKVLVANEGEPTDTGDPQGSVSIIDLSGGVTNLGADDVTTADFTAFNGQEEALRSQGVRIFPDKTAAEDFEPEYIAVSTDSTTAYVTLQESNAIAVIDIASGAVTDIQALGVKDWSQGPQLDASDEDGAINLQNWPVLGLYQPDAIATFEADGQTYYITANEGDTRDETARVEDLVLDPTAFPNAAELQLPENLGRLEVSTINGDLDGDGDYDQLYTYGGRSFSIWDSQGNLVFDSGNDFERITAELFPEYFNANNTDNDFDGRSDNKGPEPEGVTVGVIEGRTYAFIGLERVGGIMVYDITDPASSEFVEYINNRDFTQEVTLPDGSANPAAGDLAPEGLTFISAEESPNGKPFLAVANEVSGSTTLYEVNPTATSGATFTLQLLHASDLEGGIEAIDSAPNFAAITDFLEDQYENTIILSAGDNYLPGPFFSAAGDISFRTSGIFNSTYNSLFGLPVDVNGNGVLDSYAGLREGIGRVDMTIMNIIGFDASALGNHEFDLGTSTIPEIIAPDYQSTGLSDDRWVGAQFPYLSANLDFSQSNLAGLYTSEILPNTAFQTGPEQSLASQTTPKIAPATIIEQGGEQIGVVGATTQVLASISSPGAVTVIGSQENDMPALAEILQPVVDNLRSQGVNKIILVSHLQDINLEKELVGLLSGVDIIVAGGSDTLLADETDALRPGDTAADTYPVVTTNADGEPALIVSTDGEYSYVGRLVVNFDANGVLIPDTNGDFVDANVSGAYATTDEVVSQLWGSDDPFAAGTKGDQVRDITEAVEAVVIAKDSNIFGKTTVFLDGRREEVRTEETNLGNLTADANLAIAQGIDSTVLVSIKNGGGIRAPIGEIDGTTGEELPPQVNPAAGKEAGDISQLDVENSLRFNNGLTLLTITAEQLLQVIEHGVAATGPGSTPGQFPQIGGIAFSFDPDLAAGDRVQSLAIKNEAGEIVDVITENGELVGDPGRAIRIVTLNFLASGGDNYPFDDFIAANPEFANRVDILGEDANRNGILDTGEDLNFNGALDAPVDPAFDPGNANFAAFGSEQDALAEYLALNFNETNPYDQADVGPDLDTRIQNLNVREDTVLEGSGSVLIPIIGDDRSNRLIGTDASEEIQALGGNDRVWGGAGDDVIYGGDGDDRLYGDDGDDLLWGGLGDDKIWGGAGRDTFVLAVGEGSDRIEDFKVGEDFIGLADGLTFGALEIQQRGKHTVIHFGDEELALLRRVNAEQLIAIADTTFVAV